MKRLKFPIDDRDRLTVFGKLFSDFFFFLLLLLHFGVYLLIHSTNELSLLIVK